MFTTTLFGAINAASSVICQGYEIDNFEYPRPGLVQMACGDDHIAMFEDGPVQIDDEGGCTLLCYSGPEAQEVEVGSGLAALEFRVFVPLNPGFLPSSNPESPR
jgi:hypothetical protein